MKTIFLVIVVIFTIRLNAQKHDNVWVSGNPNIVGGVVGFNVDFSYLPLQITPKYRELEMYLTNASICDTAGNLLFYTNGCAIAGADDIVLDNGYDINPGSFHNLWCNQYGTGQGGGPQNALILPYPDTQGVYALFHRRYKIVGADGFCDVVMQTDVDMNLNDGKGKVVSKNIPIVNDTFSRSELVAVKHANGKDWWLISPKRNSNVFYVMQFTKDGIVDTLVQTIGAGVNATSEPINEGQGQMVFSPDGSTLYRTNRYEPVMTYGFDRENGFFISYDTIQFDYGDQFEGGVGCAVSSSGQYLYLFCRNYLYQLDLLADDISASQATVAVWDGTFAPLPALFVFGQMGPDCKIYIMSGDNNSFHIIHHPDMPGEACNVEQRGLVLPTGCGSSMPSPPNYRLGTLEDPGEPCTVMVGTGEAVPQGYMDNYSVFPNPVYDQLTIVKNQGDDGGVWLQVYDQVGRPALEKWLDMKETNYAAKIDLARLPPGSYMYSLRRSGSEVVKAGVLMKM